ncbi:amino acid aminotransferase [Pantoea sp. Mhis]|uniref:amino acid aminotransferase n=1 Tax=Pantoea sp. Mhis TaxID=2576759 RepID=UPI00135A980C|nr:amino acid aminotransferase [Pantoea sp. Mhis]MXP56137.1 aspartate/tyrosine/aromatic aminotransferase [Pantoea sp. Mhis]
MFESIPAALPDPILSLANLFYDDNRSTKINLGVGVYQDESSRTPILNCVREAEINIFKKEITKNYLNIDGSFDFAYYTQQLLFGKNSLFISRNRVYTAQVPGGTGALRIAADFIVNQTNAKRVWISNPSWPNHKNIFNAVGLKVSEYFYYNPDNHSFDIDRMIKSLKNAEAGNVILFHGCCHNPTGIDPTIDQWYQLAQLSQKRGWLPLFDFAYQGFAHGIEEDAEGLRIFTNYHQELIIAGSYSKNFGLYNERVGALTLIASSTNILKKISSQIKYSIRANYSNPPSHGAAIVITILSSKSLRNMWEEELTHMRKRIKFMRQLFVSTLEQKGCTEKFDFIIKQNGMFSLSGLTEDQVILLREKFGIYILNSGRMNIAGITKENISMLCEAVISII